MVLIRTTRHIAILTQVKWLSPLNQTNACVHATPAGKNAGTPKQCRPGRRTQQPQQRAKRAEPADTAGAKTAGKSAGKQKKSTSTSSDSRRSRQQADTPVLAQQQDGQLTTTAKQHSGSRRPASPDPSGSLRQNSRGVTVAAEAAQAGRGQTWSRKSGRTAAGYAQPPSKCTSGALACRNTATHSPPDTAGRNSHKAAAGAGTTSGVQPVPGSQRAVAVTAKSAAVVDVIDADGAVNVGPGGSTKCPKEMVAAIPAAGTAGVGGSPKELHSQKQQQPDAALITSSTIAAITPEALAAVAGSEEGNVLEFAKLQVNYR